MFSLHLSPLLLDLSPLLFSFGVFIPVFTIGLQIRISFFIIRIKFGWFISIDLCLPIIFCRFIFKICILNIWILCTLLYVYIPLSFINYHRIHCMCVWWLCIDGYWINWSWFDTSGLLRLNWVLIRDKIKESEGNKEYGKFHDWQND